MDDVVDQLSLPVRTIPVNGVPDPDTLVVTMPNADTGGRVCQGSGKVPSVSSGKLPIRERLRKHPGSRPTGTPSDHTEGPPRDLRRRAVSSGKVPMMTMMNRRTRPHVRDGLPFPRECKRGEAESLSSPLLPGARSVLGGP